MEINTHVHRNKPAKIHFLAAIDLGGITGKYALASPELHLEQAGLITPRQHQ